MKRIDGLSWLRAGAVASLLTIPVLASGCSTPKLSSPFGSSDENSTGFSSERLPEVAAAQPSVPTGPSGGSLNCPQVVAWPNERLFTVYQSGKDGDAMAVIHRGELTKLSRECRFYGGQVVVKYGFAGRVLLGPKGKSGTVTLPVTVRAAGADKRTLATDKMTVRATVPQGNPVGYFSMVREISFPVLTGTRPEDYKIFVGFKK